MSHIPPGNVISIAEKIFCMLLNVYPTTHRLEYGALLTQIFRDLCHDTYRQAGYMGLVRLWNFVLRDTVRSAAVEHIDALREGGQMMTRRQHRIILTLASLPLVLGLLLFMINPVFMGQMITPNVTQPVGWLMTAAVFILVGTAYMVQRRIIIRAQSSDSTNQAVDGNVSRVVWTIPFLVFPALLLVVFGPAIIRVLEAGL